MKVLLTTITIMAMVSVALAGVSKDLPTNTPYNPIAPMELVESSGTPGVDASCDNLGTCGTIYGPASDGVFLGDFAFNCNTREFAVTEVGGGDNFFTMTEDCDESGSYFYHDPSLYYSGRGLGYHQFEDVYFASSWNWYTTYALNTNFEVIASTYDGGAGAGNAVDEENGFLYQTTNSDPDMLVEFTINGDYTITATGNSWSVPWACGSDGYDMASLDYDDNSGYFFCINQYSNSLEWFSLSGGNLVSEGCCPLSGISLGWGFGSNGETVKVADVSSFAAPFPVYDVDAPLSGKCEGGPADWMLSYNALTDEGVNGCGVPISATVKNNTGAPAAKFIWVTTDPPSASLSLGSFTFADGSNSWYGCIPVNKLNIPSGTYDLLLAIGDTVGGAADDMDDFSATLVDPGVQ